MRWHATELDRSFSSKQFSLQVYYLDNLVFLIYYTRLIYVLACVYAEVKGRFMSFFMAILLHVLIVL